MNHRGFQTDPSASHRRAAACRRRACGLTVSEIVVLVLIGAALVAAAVSPLLGDPRPEPSAYASISVRAQDTLWDIASEHPVDGLTTAETVVLIRQVNGLGSAVIYPGQVLRVPAPTAEPLFAQR